jgi:endonuclease/exonuclease/phosphatase family metal-dependent hydrolase
VSCTLNCAALAKSPRPDLQAVKKIRVATYNIHKGVARELFGLKRFATAHELRSRLHDLRSDLIFLQEVQGKNDRHAARLEAWPEESQEVFLARTPQRRHQFETAYGKNASYMHGHHGNALLSRFTIMRDEHRDVSDHALEKRGILHCIVDVDDQPVHCFVIHFGLLARSRKRQTQALIDWIVTEVPPEAPLLIAGDFNDWQHKLSQTLYDKLGVLEVFDQQRLGTQLQSKAQDLITAGLTQIGLPELSLRVNSMASHLKSIRSARTYPSLVPWLRMDRIYIRGFRCTKVQVLRGPVWAKLSDHAPLVADLELIKS